VSHFAALLNAGVLRVPPLQIESRTVALDSLTESAGSAAVAIIGGGPAGLMAAEVLAQGGVQVDVFDAMPSVGRKFLLAGKGGLNLSHSEAMPAFLSRFASAADWLQPMLAQFGPDELRAWARGLGVETFVGSSGRVFPQDLKAAPLLRAWLHRLRLAGVRFHMRHRWVGWVSSEEDASSKRARGVEAAAGAASVLTSGADSGKGRAGQTLQFATPAGLQRFDAEVLVLALGGASWPQLGSTGAWQGLLADRGVRLVPLQPSNCGFDVQHLASDGAMMPGCSEHFRSRHAGQPLKNVALQVHGPDGRHFASPGEFVITQTGVEGSLVYAASGVARDQIAATGHATLLIDLLPARSAEFVHDEVSRPRGSRSLSTHLKSRLGLDGVKAALLHELLPRASFTDLPELARAIKALPLSLTAPRPVAEAISSAGGVRAEALDDGLMLRAVPGVFCAGEMLDWEAPTGGYLLTASMASGVWAARGVLQRLGQASDPKN
jgi:uncharacterized flavoprotein (TIGR03862 family)